MITKDQHTETNWQEFTCKLRDYFSDRADRYASAYKTIHGRRPDWIPLLEKKVLLHLNNTVVISVQGCVKGGKSTIFNILNGRPISPVGRAQKTFHPILIVPPTLDPPGVRLQDLFPDERLARIAMDDIQIITSDNRQNDLYYLISSNGNTGYVIADCPDINSTVTHYRKRAKAISQASDIIIAVLSQENAYAEDTIEFFSDAMRFGKIIIPVVSKEDPESAAEILENFKTYLKREKAIPISFKYAYCVEHFTNGGEESLCKEMLQPVKGYEERDFRDASDRKSIKLEVWGKALEKMISEAEMDLAVQKKGMETWRNVKDEIDQILTDAAENILNRVIPLRQVAEVIKGNIDRRKSIFSWVNPLNLVGKLKKVFPRGKKKVQQNLTEHAADSAREVKLDIGEVITTAFEKIWWPDEQSALGQNQSFAAWCRNNSQDFHQRLNSAQNRCCSALSQKLDQQTRAEIDNQFNLWWQNRKNRYRKGMLFVIETVMTTAQYGLIALSIHTGGIGVPEGFAAASFIGDLLLKKLGFNEKFLIPIKKSWKKTKRQRIHTILREELAQQVMDECKNWHRLAATADEFAAAMTEVQTDLNIKYTK